MCIHKISKLCPEYSWMIILWPNGFSVSAWRSVRLNCFPELHLFQGALGKGRTSPCFTTSPVGTKFSCCPGCGAAWVVPGSQRLQDGKNWTQIGAVLLQQRARQPAGVWSPEGNEKGGKDPAVLINHRVNPEHQLWLGRADLILGRGMSRQEEQGRICRSSR